MGDDAASLDLMLAGYRKALGHFQGGGDRPTILIPWIQAHMREPDRFDDPFEHPVSLAALYAALGDAVRWARAIDQRLSREMGDRCWWQPIDNGELVPATRYARNAVEHDWAQALDLGGREETLVRGDVMRHVKWARIDASRKTGRRYYEEYLLGKPVTLTLLALQVVLLNSALAVEP